MAEVRGEVRPRAHPLAWSGRGREDVRPQQPQAMETGELEKVLQVTTDQGPSGLCSGAERAGFRFLQHSSEFAWFSHAWGLFISHFYHKILQTWSLSWDCSRWPVYSGTLLLWVRGAWTHLASEVKWWRWNRKALLEQHHTTTEQHGAGHRGTGPTPHTLISDRREWSRRLRVSQQIFADSSLNRAS